MQVLVCSGSSGSSHLLQVSGIGDASQLLAAGTQFACFPSTKFKLLTPEELVGVKHIDAELPGVGKNLHEHLKMRSVFRLTNSLNGIANWHRGDAMATASLWPWSTA
jgi:choline dehydrogenase